ncbi:hypothetical protein [Aminipila terrae]|uniref:Uncharacterized protein n=1 Tax=Aminipila terrae TaxID=2697030 RepID=A0A6P1MFK7_9FIRM|nr:hypothetical protein [Aminipila terrae]QHI73480.1 hypothetical protein Ami3637_14820 [Aminipila terrae]
MTSNVSIEPSENTEDFPLLRIVSFFEGEIDASWYVDSKFNKRVSLSREFAMILIVIVLRLSIFPVYLITPSSKYLYFESL